jgi:CheY-like chemotaxis protein
VSPINRSEQYLVERARDGEEAWDLIRAKDYDRIILNLWMPRMGGQELYHRIKEYSEELATRCIFITGASRSEGLQEFIASTGNPSLSKPFNLEALRRLVIQSSSQDDS